MSYQPHVRNVIFARYGQLYLCLRKITTQISIFHPLEVVVRGSETQLRMGKKYKLINFAL